MYNLERKASQVHCLTCGAVYKPIIGCSPVEYPYCIGCNMAQSKKLIKLQDIKVSADIFRCKPGKRNGIKTEVNKQKKRRIYLVTKGVVHEKAL